MWSGRLSNSDKEVPVARLNFDNCLTPLSSTEFSSVSSSYNSSINETINITNQSPNLVTKMSPILINTNTPTHYSPQITETPVSKSDRQYDIELKTPAQPLLSDYTIKIKDKKKSEISEDITKSSLSIIQPVIMETKPEIYNYDNSKTVSNNTLKNIASVLKNSTNIINNNSTGTSRRSLYTDIQETSSIKKKIESNESELEDDKENIKEIDPLKAREVKLMKFLNNATNKDLKSLPGIGQKRAKDIEDSRPFNNFGDVQECISGKKVLAGLLEHIGLLRV